jgi:hypothetical protein
MALSLGADDKAGHILRTQQKLYSDRANFNSTWQSVAERVLPNYSDFLTSWTEGQRRTQRIYDSTAVLALEHFCAALESMLCPASQRWHRLRASDKALQNDITVQQYLDDVTDTLFRARYAPKANFQSQVHEAFAQIGAFGNGPILVDEVVGVGLLYRVQHLAQTWGIENAHGVIDTVYREIKLSAYACVRAVNDGLFDFIPTDIREMEKKDPTKKYKFYQAVYPNEQRNPQSDKYHERMAFESCIVSEDFKLTVKEGGYHTQPILFPRYHVAPKETYGRGPGVDVLPDILMLQEMEKADIRITQRAAEPPYILADDGSLPAFSLRGNSLNYGYMSPDGKPLIAQLQSASNFQVLDTRLDQKRKLIERAFLNDIFSILAEQPQMTATEVLQRAQEKGQLLAPVIGRIQSELFGPMIARELDILQRAGQLPPPPQKLRERGGVEFDIVYESEIQVVQRKSKALAVSATLQQMAPLIEQDQTGRVLATINPVRTARIIADANGAPAGMLATDEEMQQQDADAANKDQLAALAQTAGPASAALKNLAEMQKAGGSPVPGNIPGV